MRLLLYPQGFVESLQKDTESKGWVETSDHVNIAIVNALSSLITGKLHTRGKCIKIQGVETFLC